MTNLNLTRVLWLDALSCAGVFVLGVFATASLAALSGLPENVLAIGGWICLVACTLFAFLAVRPVRAFLTIGIVGNAAWVAASLAVWLAQFGNLTVLGHVLIVGQAAAVAGLTLLEKHGLNQLPDGRATAG